MSTSLRSLLSLFFRTYSPQGDGNYKADILLQLLNGEKGFSEPIPRKGTETCSTCLHSEGYYEWFFRTYSPQGDGNRR